MLDGWGVYHAVVDARDGAVYAAANHVVYGPTVQFSTDAGSTWRRSRKIGLPEDSGLTLNATWHIEPGPEAEPGTLFLGADPGVLFQVRAADRATCREARHARPGPRRAQRRSTAAGRAVAVAVPAP